MAKERAKKAENYLTNLMKKNEEIVKNNKKDEEVNENDFFDEKSIDKGIIFQKVEEHEKFKPENKSSR